MKQIVDLLKRILAALFRIERKVADVSHETSDGLAPEPSRPRPEIPVEPEHPLPSSVPVERPEEDEDFGETLGEPFEPAESGVDPTSPHPGRPGFVASMVGNTILLAIGDAPGTLLVMGYDSKNQKIDGRYLAKLEATTRVRIGKGFTSKKFPFGDLYPRKRAAAVAYRPDGASAWSEVWWVWPSEAGEITLTLDRRTKKPSVTIRNVTGDLADVQVVGGGTLRGYVSFAKAADGERLLGRKTPPYPKASFHMKVATGTHRIARIDLSNVTGTTPKYLHVGLVQAGKLVAKASRKI